MTGGAPDSDATDVVADAEATDVAPDTDVTADDVIADLTADEVVADVLVVDAANVVGARADGWWRDRAGAAARLVAALAVLPERPARVVVVLEGRARDAVTEAAEAAGVEVVRAARDGDDAVVDAVRSRVRPGVDVLVVTSDRELRARVEAEGARARGAGWLQGQIDAVHRPGRTPRV
ncbi:NYN domain-containing protein [Cellulomonas marina]|uniref:YacP-like NYN domain-containing protein n=1 Tax=Cellulomonas marina TaxID=988821 RepID=A0A1I0ZAA1_9CELL|nr:NYN domain-containing protein [Cellulomonas marina]GIG28991.1 hypothetical protein Cma02nite_15910 [Cellulomonas marina]SFB22574.1 YacP-like NYN domain-containing protein [Cellulomonas marina]